MTPTTEVPLGYSFKYAKKTSTLPALYPVRMKRLGRCAKGCIARCVETRRRARRRASSSDAHIFLCHPTINQTCVTFFCRRREGDDRCFRAKSTVSVTPPPAATPLYTRRERRRCSRAFGPAHIIIQYPLTSSESVKVGKEEKTFFIRALDDDSLE